jgi:hypothetical protein
MTCYGEPKERGRRLTHTTLKVCFWLFDLICRREKRFAGNGLQTDSEKGRDGRCKWVCLFSKDCEDWEKECY